MNHERIKKKVAFLAAPFSQKFNRAEGVNDISLRRTLEAILRLLKDNEYEVRSAHLREDWGNNPMSPSVFVPLDYEWIGESDLFIAYVDNTSSGLFIEIGWASALRKNIVILSQQGISLSPMIYGLGEMTRTRTEILSFIGEKDLIEKLKTFLVNIQK
jgi:nucleoside 2-deoxyribosyltransferase